MKAYEWIDRLKVKKQISSDYAVAKMLGMSQSSIISMRSRKSTFDEDAAVKVAQLLGINPTGIVIDQAAERAKSPEVRSTLAAEAQRLCILCKVTAATILIAAGARPMRRIA